VLGELDVELGPGIVVERGKRRGAPAAFHSPSISPVLQPTPLQLGLQQARNVLRDWPIRFWHQARVKRQPDRVAWQELPDLQELPDFLRDLCSSAEGDLRPFSLFSRRSARQFSACSASLTCSACLGLLDLLCGRKLRLFRLLFSSPQRASPLPRPLACAAGLRLLGRQPCFFSSVACRAFFGRGRSVPPSAASLLRCAFGEIRVEARRMGRDERIPGFPGVPTRSASS